MGENLIQDLDADLEVSLLTEATAKVCKIQTKSGLRPNLPEYMGFIYYVAA